MRKKPSLKLVVTYKNRKAMLESDLIVPIQTGRAISDDIFDEMLGDDTGDNISAKNEDYGECTAQYWVWKNYKKIGNPDYIGFMHYRRILNFARTPISFFDDLDFSSAPRLCKKYDIIVSEKLPAYSPKLKKHVANMQEQWNAEFNPQDLDLVVSIIKKEYPDMATVVDEYLSAPTAYWYNIFVMKKDLFMEYSDWFFGILKQCEGRVFGDRAVGMLGERIMNVFIEYKRTQGAKILELPLFRPQPIQYTKDNLVPVVLTSSNAYIHQTSAAILSVIKNCKDPKRLKFVILSSGISPENKEKCLKFFKNYNLQIVDIQGVWLNKFDNIAMPAHVSKATFARLLAPSLLFCSDKIIYIDGDVLVRKDILDLYNIDISGYSLGLCEDVANTYHSKRLGTDDYYNCGIMLFNSKKYRQVYNSSKAWKVINQNRTKYRICDQDVINDVFRGDIFCLNPTWNFHYLKHPVLFMYKMRSFAEYKEAEADPAIVHFVGPDKPWLPSCQHAYRKEYIPFYRKMRYDETIVRKEKYKDRTAFHNYTLFFNIPVYHIIKENDIIKKYVCGVRLCKVQKRPGFQKTSIFGICVKSYKKTPAEIRYSFMGFPYHVVKILGEKYKHKNQYQ